MPTLNPFKIYENFDNASFIGRHLESYQMAIKGIYEAEEERAKNALLKFGEVKRDCYNSDGIYHQLLHILENLEEQGRLKTVELKGKKYHFSDIKPSQRCLDVCIASDELMKSTTSGVLAGSTGGLLISYGAFSLAGLIGTASTGTAISALSGSAALNATLAWLGGGAIAAGGLGMTAGMIVLGGLFAVPAALISTISLGAKSDTLLANARSKLEEARVEESKAKVAAEKVREIGKTAQFGRKILESLVSMGISVLPNVRNLIVKDGDDWTDLDEEYLYQGVCLCKLINDFSEIDPLDEESGDLNPKAKDAFRAIKQTYISELEK